MPKSISTRRLVALEAVKILLSLAVAYALVYPFLQAEPVGLAKEIALLGITGAIILGVIFFSLVVAYANDLRLVLNLLKPEYRLAKPNSVWWMLVLPYNFIEDFFIIAAVSHSLRRQAENQQSLQKFKSFGLYSGYGWCVAQILSLLPNQFGSLAAVLALPIWLYHWHLIRKIKQSLSTPTTNSNAIT